LFDRRGHGCRHGHNSPRTEPRVRQCQGWVLSGGNFHRYGCTMGGAARGGRPMGCGALLECSVGVSSQAEPRRLLCRIT
jgi:hypothetical protein